MSVDPMQYPLKPGTLVRMKNLPEGARKWMGVYLVPVGELGTVIEGDGKVHLKVSWPQVPFATWTPKKSVEVVEETK